MKRLLFISLIVILAIGLVLGSCAKEEPTPTPTPTPAPAAPAPAAPAPAKPAPAAPAPAAPAPAKPAPAAPAAKAGPYGTITTATTDFGVEATDPILFESTWGWLMYDSLLAFTPQGDYVGKVAESWNLSPDGKTWTFHIRKGIKFHNGDPLTANDVLFEMERFSSPESKNPWSNQLRDQKVSHRVIDDYTYEFVTKDAQPQLLDTFCWVRILPKKYFETVGQDEFRKHPIGSGPWKFVMHVPETSFRVEANTEYWMPERVPYFKYLVDLQVPEEATQVAMLKRGEIDIPFGITTDRLVELRMQGWQTRLQGIAPANILAIIGPHLEKSGPVYDIRIRKALSYAINRQEMCDTIWRGLAKPGGRFFLTPGSYGVTDDLIAPDPYDPDKAKALLKEAGYPEKFADPTINCFTPAGPGMDFWQALQGYWTKVGIKAKINIVDMGVWLQYIFIQKLKGDDACLGWIWSWAGSAFNGTAYCRNLYTSYGIHQVTVDAKVTALFDKYIAELDPVKAKQYYIDWQRGAKDLYTSIGIAYTDPLLIVSNNIGDFTVNPHMAFQDAACGVKHPGQ
jgi:peptide/nickel transport system substrate-binding protein